MSAAAILHERVRIVRANNPGPYTLDGTNTYLIGERAPVVIDPGPDDEEHLQRVLDEAGSISRIVLSHTHIDHAAGAARLARMAGAPLAAFSAAACIDAAPIADGDQVAPGLRAVYTPGHASDHLCFLLEEERILLSGDHVLGRGTTVIVHPDGNLKDYLASLRTAQALDAHRIFPGHGPVVENPAAVLDYYAAHRAEREEQIIAALRAGARTIDEIVGVVYPDLAENLHRAAGMSVHSHLDKLLADGVATTDDDRWAIA